MTTILILLVIIGIVAGLLWMFLGRRSPTRRRGGNLRKYEGFETDVTSRTPLGGIEKLKSNSLFYGLEMGQPGCEAAMAILGKQYIFTEAPTLPLEGCTSAMCTCQFKGLPNRRSWHRRQHNDPRVEVRFEKDKPDRRSHKNRRRNDNNWNDHTL